MPPIYLQRAGILLDRLMRPERAARNAQQAAAAAARDVEDRRRLEVEIADLAAAEGATRRAASRPASC